MRNQKLGSQEKFSSYFMLNFQNIVHQRLIALKVIKTLFFSKLYFL